MRLVVLTLALAGCHAATPPPAAKSGLVVHVALSTAPTGGDVAIASVALRLDELRGVSDRSASDPRAASSEIDLQLGDATDVALPSAPPGLYSAVDALVGSSADTGLDLQAVWHAARVHATLVSPPFDIRCDTPVEVEPGRAARLAVAIDPSGWFANVDLTNATSDPDDAGIVISADDNQPVAAALLSNVMASFTLACAAQ